MLTLTPRELTILLEKTPDTIDLIDVRGTDEYTEVQIPQARNIPLHLLPFRMNEVNRNKQVIIICRSGARSSQACSLLDTEKIQCHNLTGGMIEFEREFPQLIVHGEKKKLFWIF